MTALTSGILDGGPGVYHGLIVRIPEKLQGYIRVTGPASITPRILRIGGPLREQGKRRA